jgi:hypothetical protein
LPFCPFLVIVSTKIGGELRCSGSVSSSCSTSEDAVLIYIHNCKNQSKLQIISAVQRTCSLTV